MRGLVTAAAIAATFGGAGVAKAGTVTLANGVMAFEAAPGEANRVFVIRGVGGMHLLDTGVALTAGGGCTQVNANEAFCASEDLTSLEINVVAGDEDDYVDLRPADVFYTSKLDGGEGDDSLFGGLAFTGTMFEGGPGGDAFYGNGAVDYSSRTNPVTVTIGDDLANDGEASEGDLVSSDIDQVYGGHGADTLTALNAPDLDITYLRGGEGDDHVSALKTDWTAIVEGNDGDDVLHNASAEGTIFGGDGDDLLVGDHGGQALWGQKGNDRMRGQAGNDLLRGGAGADELSGGPAKDQMFGNDGNDRFMARDGKVDYSDGGGGTDKARADTFDHLVRIEKTF
jgi:Ca2+-binding RTX toxin-like protein